MLFLFCGRRRDRINGLYWEKDGFILLYKRLEQAKPVLDALLSWANEVQARTAPKSALGKAVHYLREQWPHLTRYLEDSRLELSNNRAESSIKPLCDGQEELAVCQYTRWRAGQQRDLQPDCNGEGERP